MLILDKGGAMAFPKGLQEFHSRTAEYLGKNGVEEDRVDQLGSVVEKLRKKWSLSDKVGIMTIIEGLAEDGLCFHRLRKSKEAELNLKAYRFIIAISLSIFLSSILPPLRPPIIDRKRYRS